MTKIDRKFSKELKKYGAFDFTSCYNCGNCTAVCSLATKDEAFPRELVRLSALGIKEEIESSLKPWSCYYCGECSTYCPQSANPGELMMSLRRWLTARYDWTGFSGLLYRSLPLLVVAMLLAVTGVILFAFFNKFEAKPIMHLGHLFEMFAIGTVFVVILLPNIIRMWYLAVIRPGTNPSLARYIKGAGTLFIHMFTQKRALGCDNNQRRWFEHFILVIGYLTLLLMTVVFDWLGTANPIITVAGYIVSIIVFSVTADFVKERIKAKREISRHSRPSDWLFVIWLFLMGFTAFIVRLFVDVDLIENNIWIYLIHLTVLVQWAMIIVPFGKWTHFLYRSFALYFQEIIKKR
ncbi:MAG: 4Fe-4S dicluster domain-containing protein [Bacteroidales bacterium]|nr:4Fe-4S dicluster domain-containing protein [Bacteroidales bacterium]MDD2424935.1 4Fe-4S dicluster domain-containing protein [Bacteroidales bacterium]MDD3989087.1 4Fe-4S dicluster domain-containing protein [Bacteroidales bacterium]MDD4638470.1 4Fe-4S dicluster domain-containing protein [Bacteroidales bacterium]